jgi:hypothetical protein
MKNKFSVSGFKDAITVLPGTVLIIGDILFTSYLVLFLIKPPTENTEMVLKISYGCFILTAILIFISWLWALKEWKERYWEDDSYKGLWFRIIILNPLSGPVAYYYCVIRYTLKRKNSDVTKSKDYLKSIKNKSLLDTLCFIYYWGALITLIPFSLIFLLKDTWVLGIIVAPMITFVVPAALELFYLLILLICGSQPKNEWQTLNAFSNLKASTILFSLRNFYYSAIRDKIVK